MTFQEFEKAVLDTVNFMLPSDRVARTKDVRKANGVIYTGIFLERVSEVGASAIVYLEPLYERQKSDPDFTVEAISGELVKILLAPVRDDAEFWRITDYDFARERVIFRLMSVEGNEALLENLPHRRFLDLAVTYAVYVTGDAGSGITKVTKEIANHWEVSEEKLNELAEANTARLLPFLCRPLLPDAELMEAEHPFESRFYILSNREAFFGSSALLYGEELRKLASRLRADLYVLPVTVHELFTMPVGSLSEADCRKLFSLMRAEEPQPENLLSPSIYRYSLKSGSLAVLPEKCAPETPLRAPLEAHA